MKHLKKFTPDKKELKYKEGDFAIYDKYLNQPGILVEVITARSPSLYPYFVQEVKPPHQTHSLESDDLIDLTTQEREELDIYLNSLKYNL